MLLFITNQSSPRERHSFAFSGKRVISVTSLRYLHGQALEATPLGTFSPGEVATHARQLDEIFVCYVDPRSSIIVRMTCRNQDHPCFFASCVFFQLSLVPFQSEQAQPYECKCLLVGRLVGQLVCSQHQCPCFCATCVFFKLFLVPFQPEQAQPQECKCLSVGRLVVQSICSTNVLAYKS